MAARNGSYYRIGRAGVAAARAMAAAARATVTVAMILIMSGCAVGNKYSYRDVVATVPATGGKRVAIATHDQRSYIVSGDKSPTFVGIQRGGFGNPFDVTNKHNEPLSTSYSIAACNALKAAGAQCTVIETNHLDHSSTVVQKLQQSGQDVSLMFTLNEWKTDALLSTALIYDVTLDALSRDGTVTASKTIRGKDDLDGSFWNGPGHGRKATPMAFKAKLESMLGSPEIQAAIGGSSFSVSPVGYTAQPSRAHTTPVIVESPRAEQRAKIPVTQAQTVASGKSGVSCTVNQILEMKKLGLSDAQIERSCQ